GRSDAVAGHATRHQRAGVRVDELPHPRNDGAAPEQRCRAVRHALERFDGAHARTLRASFNVEQEDALLYHIVLNTDRLPVDACVDAVCQLAEHPRFRNRATTRTELADKLLEAKISSALTEEIGIATAPTGVTVSAVNGRITL